MPFRPRGYTRAAARRPPGPQRRYMRLKMRMRRAGIRQPVQFFRQQQYYPAWLTSSTTVDVVQNITFNLNAVTQVSTFTSLYDQYCIKGVKATLIPRGNVDGVSNPFSTPTFSILDYDGTFPTTIAGMNEYQNVRMKRGTQIHKRYLVPAVLQEVFQSSIATAYSTRKKPWIDCSNPTVPHYGAAFGVSATPAQAISWDLKVEYFLAFKNVR